MVVSFSQSKQRYIPPDCCTEMKEYDDACKVSPHHVLKHLMDRYRFWYVE